MRWGFLALLCLVAWCAPAMAQLQQSRGLSTRDEIRLAYFQQNLGAQIPTDAAFVDDGGRPVRLGDYLGRLPTLLVLAYFTCPDLCPMTFRHLTEELNGVAPMAGRDFQVIIISFDPRDTPAAAAVQKDNCLRAYKWPASADAWHFLTGRQPAVDAVTRTVGFHYAFDQQQGRFIHPTGVMVLSPAGRLTHYFFGIDAPPADMESAIHDAAAGRPTRVDQPEQEYCADYDPTLSVRGRWVMRIIRTGCIAWLALLVGYIGYKITGDIRRRGPGSASRSYSQEAES